MKRVISLNVNGQKHEVFTDPSRLPLDVLREDLYLTGAKEGCGTGECGACTVLVNGKPVRSCLMVAGQAEGKDILTIEGVSRNGSLHPLQQSFIEHFAVQCGYCTSGMILTAKALLDANPNPTEPEIREALSGNLCRCTGYIQIVEAILAVSKMACPVEKS